MWSQGSGSEGQTEGRRKQKVNFPADVLAFVPKGWDVARDMYIQRGLMTMIAALQGLISPSLHR